MSSWIYEDGGVGVGEPLQFHKRNLLVCAVSLSEEAVRDNHCCHRYLPDRLGYLVRIDGVE